jgi:hypothetical protein
MIRSAFSLAFLAISIWAGAAVDSDKDNASTSVPADHIPHTTDSLLVELTASFQSRHIWRGSLTCDAWNIQPSFNISKNNFLVGAWAAYTVDNSYAEVDVYASYSIGNLTFSLLDYFCPNETIRFNRFFDLNQSTTQHTVDATISFDGTKQVPFSLMVSTLLWGDDLNPATGKNYYSTYIEAGYNWSRTATQDYQFFVGLTPYRGYYADSFNIVGVGAGVNQKIKITDSFSLPVFGKLILNPYTENLFVVFGFSLQKS